MLRRHAPRTCRSRLRRWLVYFLYCREKGPMGGTPCIGSRLGDGPIFDVLVSQLDVKECPGKLQTGSSYSNSSHGYYWLQPYSSTVANWELGQPVIGPPCTVDGSRIKWAWLRLLAVHDHYFVLKRGIRLTRLNSAVVSQVTYWSSLTSWSSILTNQWFELRYSRAATHGHIFE